MLNENTIKKNLNKVLANVSPSDYDEGLQWYKNARVFAYHLSQKYSLPYIKCCAVIAALSPRNKWERNKLDADMLIYTVLFGKQEHKTSTYTLMRDKAIKIILSKDNRISNILNILNGPKITAFFLNIYQVDNNCVTVDTWIHLVAQGKYIETRKRKNLNKTLYKRIEEVIKNTAAEYGIKPYELQAIAWVGFKRMTKESDYN